MNQISKKTILSVLFLGFLIWLLATLAFRFGGQLFFITESALALTILYAIVIPSLVLISTITFKKFRLTGLENVLAGTLLVLPGMIIDTFVIQFFEDVFPNIPAHKAASFGSWLMWAYSVVLFTSVITALRQKPSK